ncbi:hypothetical [Prochlorococcus marinus str. MIT 9313]|uniref:Uncharacterized protein n=1 Tax=Prochlorococcus marinus (strain MIT 9313) TaxID=74547 RepID=Q7V888_PROMM|nr:hypothetical [Prochlorococcus marinus str. MIT 9313]
MSSFWQRSRDNLVASIVAYASWLVVDWLGHVSSLVVQSNDAPSNVGTILFTDLLMPILVVILLWLSREEQTRLKPKPKKHFRFVVASCAPFKNTAEIPLLILGK